MGRRRWFDGSWRSVALTLASCTAVACGSGDIGDGDVPDAGVELGCEPGASPTWVTEGEAVSIVVDCQGLAPLGDNTLSVRDLPSGAAFDAATQTLTWTPGLDQAAVYELVVEVVETSELGTFTVGVADAFDDPGNTPVVDPELYSHEFGVPVLFMDTAPTETDVDQPVAVTYAGRTIAAEGHLRGASSLSYPKQNFLLKFPGSARFSDIDKGFTGRRRVVLTSTFDDNAYVRQRLVFELWNALEPTLPIEAYHAVVYVDGEYFGLYLVTDHPSGHWLDALGLSPDADLFKAINHDANFRTTDNNGDPKSTLSQGYDKKEGPPGDFTSIESLVDFVANSNQADFASQLPSQIDLAEYNKWWALVVFTLATDSAGKNSYHYRDTGPFAVVPWDFNASFGQSWETSRLPETQVSSFSTRNEIWNRCLADVALAPGLITALRDAIESGPFSVASLDARVDDIVLEIDRSARRDWSKWEDDYLTHNRWAGRNDFTDYDGELMYVRDWIAARRQIVLDWLDNQ